MDAVLLCLEKELVEHLANPEKNKGHVRKPIAVIPFELLKKVIDHTDGLDCFKNTSMEELKRWINTVSCSTKIVRWMICFIFKYIDYNAVCYSHFEGYATYYLCPSVCQINVSSC